MSCSGDMHHFAEHAELCDCGKENRHARCKCDKCGNEHWLPRRASIQREDDFKLNNVEKLDVLGSELNRNSRI